MGLLDWFRRPGRTSDAEPSRTARPPDTGSTETPRPERPDRDLIETVEPRWFQVDLERREPIDLSDSIGDFGMELAEGTDANLVCSAFSIYEAWLRVWAGSRGACRSELEKALALPPDPEGVREELGQRIEAIRAASSDDCTITTANAIWHQPGLAIAEDFERDWGGFTRELDFSDPLAAAAEINRWVEEHTGGMIRDMFDRSTIGALGPLMIGNACHLNAKWAYPFEADETEPAPFTTLEGEETRVPMMRQTGYQEMVVTESFELLAKDYAGRRLRFVIVLPAAGRFAEVRRSLRYAALRRTLASCATTGVLLEIPRFRLDSQPDIDPLLKSRGADSVYSSDTADLTGLSPNARVPGQELFVRGTRHRAVIDVDEERTEASAATLLDVPVPGLFGPTRPYEFRANRPFLFFVVDRKTETPLFSGQVVDPSEG